MAYSDELNIQRNRFELRRQGRFLIAALKEPHMVLSTSAVNGGLVRTVEYVVNHQSCEAKDLPQRYEAINAEGPSAYHARVCAEIGLDGGATVLMGTAANMNYAAVVERGFEDLEVCAVVTAGVQGNAACAGDKAVWHEGPEGWKKVGTINTMLFVNRALTEGALTRAVVTMTEAKTAALQRLAVGSLYSEELATGTGTDQFAIAAPLEGERVLTSTSPHVKLGQLIGEAVRDATMEALRWQNGLEQSYTRGLFHALGRYGVKEATFAADMEPLLDAKTHELLRRNLNAVIYEPSVAACAYAIAAVADRVRHGMLPESVGREAMLQQAALLAANLAARDCFSEFRAKVEMFETSVKGIVLGALALGWSSKWPMV